MRRRELLQGYMKLLLAKSVNSVILGKFEQSLESQFIKWSKFLRIFSVIFSGGLQIRESFSQCETNYRTIIRLCFYCIFKTYRLPKCVTIAAHRYRCPRQFWRTTRYRGVQEVGRCSWRDCCSGRRPSCYRCSSSALRLWNMGAPLWSSALRQLTAGVPSPSLLVMQSTATARSPSPRVLILNDVAALMFHSSLAKSITEVFRNDFVIFPFIKYWHMRWLRETDDVN